MEQRKITEEMLRSYHQYLLREEKSTATVEEYLRDVRAFAFYAGESEITKEVVLEYKRELQEKEYAVRSINSMLASLNSFLIYGLDGLQGKVLQVTAAGLLCGGEGADQGRV